MVKKGDNPVDIEGAIQMIATFVVLMLLVITRKKEKSNSVA